MIIWIYVNIRIPPLMTVYVCASYLSSIISLGQELDDYLFLSSYFIIVGLMWAVSTFDNIYHMPIFVSPCFERLIIYILIVYFYYKTDFFDLHSYFMWFMHFILSCSKSMSTDAPRGLEANISMIRLQNSKIYVAISYFVRCVPNIRFSTGDALILFQTSSQILSSPAYVFF